ncbi:hypothetical protein PGB90_002799 [Kerria lacca]
MYAVARHSITPLNSPSQPPQFNNRMPSPAGLATRGDTPPKNPQQSRASNATWGMQSHIIHTK